MKNTGSKKAQATSRGKVIAAAKKKTGTATYWKKVFATLDKSKKRGR